MGIFETFSLALKNVAGSKMRTFLTMLGIIIGVCAVIVIIGLGNGMTIYMEDQFASMGTNTLSVSILGRGSSRSVSEDQMYELVAENPEYLENVSPTVTMSGKVKIGTETIKKTAVTGVSEGYFDMKGYDVAAGRNLQYMDIKDRKKVCVVGMYLADEYYGSADKAIGQTVKVGSAKLSIVGVMAQEADELESGSTDDCIYLPYSTAARLSGMGNISSYTVTIQSEDTASEAKEIVEHYLFDIYEDDDAYMVISMTEILSIMTKMINIVIYVLAFIAGISLVVGGIGIMNIMLVSVTERTREIGIRKALGAKERVILCQFVMEAAITSVLGGIVGIGAGYGLSSIATRIIYLLAQENLKVTPTLGSIALAVGVSAGIGVLFGYLPARKAARLNPIDALRYE